MAGVALGGVEVFLSGHVRRRARLLVGFNEQSARRALRFEALPQALASLARMSGVDELLAQGIG